MTSDQPSLASKFDDDDDKVFADRMSAFDRELHHDYPEDKLGRELSVILGGTVDAGKTAFGKDHIAGTVLNAVGSAAVGFGIRAAEAEFPALRPAIAIGGAALTVSFIRDLLGKGSEVGGILSDVWRNPDNEDKDRTAFAKDGGKFVFDTALSAGAGLAGSALGNRVLFGESSDFTRIATYDGPGLLGKSAWPHERLYSKNDPVAAIFENNKDASLELTGRYAVGSKKGILSNATAFFISDDGLALTNHHAVAFREGLTVTDRSGQTYKASVLASDKPNDLAVLQVERGAPGSAFKPVKLAQNDAQEGDRVFAMGRHRGDEPTFAPGTVRDFHTIQVSEKAYPPGSSAKPNRLLLTPFSRELYTSRPTTNKNGLADSVNMLSSYFSKPGVSGSPVFNTDGEVVAVHNGSLGNWFSKLTARNTSTPISASADLIEAAIANRNKMF